MTESQRFGRYRVTRTLGSGATPLHEVVHAFSPHGVTGVVVIAESHFAIHTWPEHRFAAVDLFTCGDAVDPYRAFDHLRGALAASTHSVVEIRRGLFPGDVKHKP